MAKPTPTSSIGPTARVRGNVTGPGSLGVAGEITGDVRVDGEVVVAQGGRIEGDVTGESVAVEGTLLGDVTARGPVTLGPQATLRGKVSAERVSIVAGARVAIQVDARFDLEPVRKRGR
ncbi:MAG: polymer-forming cytoskeletal protein [Polyangiaceae bacterium]|nr:polymer-forming cytoskeletal protein [Polyangiaceae bacterium]